MPPAAATASRPPVVDVATQRKAMLASEAARPPTVRSPTKVVTASAATPSTCSFCSASLRSAYAKA